MTTMTHSARWMAFGLLCLTAGCTRPFVANTPEGSLELEGQGAAGYDYRAAHPDGLVMSVRVIDNAQGASLSFYSQAVDNQLRLFRGYALVEKKSVHNADGIDGLQLRYGHDEGTKPHSYYVTLFLDGDEVFVIEQGGETELVKKHEADCAAFIAQFSIRSGLGRLFSYEGQ
jgi:hypothetical protein